MNSLDEEIKTTILVDHSKTWTTEKFILEFSFSNINFMRNRIQTIIDHWKICHPCTVSFAFGENRGTFEEIYLKLLSFPIEQFICKHPSQKSFFEVCWTKKNK